MMSVPSFFLMSTGLAVLSVSPHPAGDGWEFPTIGVHRECVSLLTSPHAVDGLHGHPTPTLLPFQTSVPV